MKNLKQKQKGFTLIELLIVIAIIGLMASIAMVSLGNARSKSRDSARRQNLLQLQKALELYYNTNGSYPSTNSQWWGQTSFYGNRAQTGANGYIPDLAPNYVPVLPRDPFTNKGGGDGFCAAGGYWAYLYRSDGRDYKLLAHCLPEQYSTVDQFYDPNRPGWAWQISTTGGRAW
jgi:prepilin-type N-terminal cleavage/methylation domain-containing protein